MINFNDEGLAKKVSSLFLIAVIKAKNFLFISGKVQASALQGLVLEGYRPLPLH